LPIAREFCGRNDHVFSFRNFAEDISLLGFPRLNKNGPFGQLKQNLMFAIVFLFVILLVYVSYRLLKVRIELAGKL
jgi:hypothetical protein